MGAFDIQLSPCQFTCEVLWFSIFQISYIIWRITFFSVYCSQTNIVHSSLSQQTEENYGSAGHNYKWLSASWLQTFFPLAFTLTMTVTWSESSSALSVIFKCFISINALERFCQKFLTSLFHPKINGCNYVYCDNIFNWVKNHWHMVHWHKYCDHFSIAAIIINHPTKYNIAAARLNYIMIQSYPNLGFRTGVINISRILSPFLSCVNIHIASFT